MGQSDYIKKLLRGRSVEWVKLGEVAEIKRGKTITAKSKTDGDIPVISGGQKPAYYNADFNRKGETITIAGSGAYAGFVMYWNEPIFVSDAFSVKPNLVILNTKYIFYYLLNKQNYIYNLKRGSGVPHVYPKDLATLQIPLPPLDVQERIAEILDKFTELTKELTKELGLRKKQYTYYRDKLLTFGDDVEWRELGEVGDVCMCKRILKNQTTEKGDIPFYKIGTFGKTPNAYISKELFEEYKSKYSYPKKGEVLISASGTIGRTIIFDGKDAYFQDSNIVWIDNNESQVLNKYLFYFYKIAKWHTSKGGTITRLYNKDLKKLQIPIPPLAEQERIVKILDKFDTLTNSISEGLPREIELRQKQYEYYRNLLLTF